MRFCDLFISYKIGLKRIKRTIPFTKLPLYRKIAFIASYSTIILSLIFFVLKIYIIGCSIIGIAIIGLIIFIIIDSKKKNLETMLYKYYAPYSEKRMNTVIKILQNYGIDIKDIDAIDFLIEEAQIAQTQCDYILPLKKPLKMLNAIIIPIVAFVAQKIGNTSTQNEMITMAIQVIILILLLFSFIYSIASIIKPLIYRDYNLYNNLIYDLRQIKLFYSK